MRTYTSIEARAEQAMNGKPSEYSRTTVHLQAGDFTRGVVAGETKCPRLCSLANAAGLCTLMLLPPFLNISLCRDFTRWTTYGAK